MRDTITVSPDGRWTATNAAGTQRTGTLTDEQRSRLRALTANTSLRQEAARPTAPTKCRDAFNYALLIDSITVSYVDCPADPGLPATAMSVVDLLNEATR